MNETSKKALVVGAGFAGATTARELAEAGWQVLVIDARNHVAGNAYDYINELGIRVHKYGPHLWHGSNDEVQNWASRFTEWIPYKHWVLAQLEGGRHVPLPINAKTIMEIFGKEFRDFALSDSKYWGYWDEADGSDDEKYYKPCAYDAFLETKRVKYDEITNSRQHVESSVGTTLTDLFFAPYTKKMWGMGLEDLPTSVAARIPTKTDFDKYYFPKDKYQFVPKDGYTKMVENILDHENITVSLSTKRQELMQYVGPEMHWTCKSIKGWNDATFDVVFTSEPIDTYYDCDLGELPWRSIKCHTYNVPVPHLLEAPVVNFTHDGPHTRATEWKQIPGHGDNPRWTTLTVEEPCDYRDNNMERYYPVKTSHAIDPNRELYKKYRERAKADGIHFIGRCGRYVYTDMIPCINSTLNQVRKFLAGDTIPESE